MQILKRHFKLALAFSHVVTKCSRMSEAFSKRCIFLLRKKMEIETDATESKVTWLQTECE